MDVRFEEHEQGHQGPKIEQQLLELTEPHAEAVSGQHRDEEGAPDGQGLVRQPTERDSGAEETRRYKTKHYLKGEITSEEQAGPEAQRQDRTG